MISFEFKTSGDHYPDELEIYLDKEGVNSLIAQLEMLRSERTDHVHLMNNYWGGSHLAGGAHNSANSAISHVKILMV